MSSRFMRSELLEGLRNMMSFQVKYLLTLTVVIFNLTVAKRFLLCKTVNMFLKIIHFYAIK